MSDEYLDYEHKTNRSRKIAMRHRCRVDGWPCRQKKFPGMSTGLRRRILVSRAEREIIVKVSDGKKLLFSVTKKDFNFQTFRAGGKGGQHQNKRDTGVRCVHKASSAVGEGRDSKSQKDNKKNAFLRCVNSDKFQGWLKIEAAKIMGEEVDIEKKVEELMKPENLIIEYSPFDE